MKPSRADLRSRLYEHGLDLIEEAPVQSEPAPASFVPRSRPLSARLESAQQSHSGTVDVAAARRLLGSLRSKGGASPRRQNAARALVASAGRSRSAPRSAAQDRDARLSRGLAVPYLPDIKKTSGPGSTTIPFLPPLPGSAAGSETHKRKELQPTVLPSQRDPFDVFIELLRSAQQQGEQAEGLEFVYVRHIPGGGPYDVELIPFHVVDQAHYLTVSPHGFTEYINGTPCEFVSLERWLDERQLYRAVHELRFFQEFPKRKAFHRWHDAVSQERMSKASAVLEDRLFMLHPEFRRLLLDVRQLCLQLSETRVVNVQFASAKTIPEFSSIQRSWRKDVLVNAGEIAASLRREILNTFSAILDRVRRETRGPGATLSSLGAGNAVFGNRAALSRLGAPAPPAAPRGARHGLQVKADGEALEALGFPKDIGYGQRSALRKECGRFVRFGQLADLLATDALLELARGSLTDIVAVVSPATFFNRSTASISMTASFRRSNLLNRSATSEMVSTFTTELTPLPDRDVDSQSTQKQKTAELEESEARLVLAPLFKVEADIAENDDGELADMELWPDRETLLQTLMKSVEDGCKLMEVFERLATHRDLEPYRAVLDPLDYEMQPRRQVNSEGEEEEAHSESLGVFVEHLWQQDAWKHTLEQLQTAVNTAFDEAYDLLNDFDGHVHRCRECLRMDMGVQVAAACNSNSVHDLGRLLDEYEKEVSELHDVPANLTLQVLDVDIANVKNQLLKGPTKCRRHLHTMLPEMVSMRSASLLEWITLCKRQLAAEPTSIDTFVQQTCRLEQIEIQVHEQAHHLARVLDLCKLITLHNIEMSGPGRKQAAGVEREFKEFRQWIAAKEGDISRLKDHFAVELENLVDALANNVEELAAKVHSELFLVLVTEHDEFVPGTSSPAQALVAAGKIPQILSGDDVLRDQRLKEDVDDKVSQLQSLRDEYDGLRATLNRYNEYQEMLGHELAQSPALNAVQEDLAHRANLWEAMQSWLTLSIVWMSSTLGDSSIEDITKKVAKLWQQAREAQGALPSNPVFEELRSYIMIMRDSLPALAALQNVHLKERHMRSISDALQAHLDVQNGLPSLLVGNLVELDVARRRADIQGISSRATQEHVIEVQLNGIETIWSSIEFDVVQYRPEQRDTYILGPTEHILSQADDSLVTIAAILASRAVQVHVENAREWQRKLQTVREVLTEWTTCQQKWKYLDRIFVVSDIQKQLIGESNLFQNVDASWKEIMTDTIANPQVLSACLQQGLLENIRQHNRTLDAVERELNDYVETKRMAFPRFYFLSNEELLTITAHGREPRVIEQHLQKCFDGICRLDFGDDRNFDILGMISQEGERVGLGRLKIRTHIEETLDVIQSTMLAVLRRAVHAALDDAVEKDEEWEGELANWLSEPDPAQAIHTAARIVWCRTVEEALQVSSKGSLTDVQGWHEKKRLGSLVRLSQTSLGALQRCSVLSLLTAEVHGRDILSSLVKKGVESSYNFEWQKHLRYYWELSDPLEAEQIDACVIRQLDVQLAYGFEYEGVAPRLVITPLTERCWLATTQALQIKQGTAVSGPTGAGKTETIKDLAKSLAILCIVFNCSDQVSCQMTGQLISGLAQQGCWACLDEFNCVALDVLSVVAQQIYRVHQGLLTGRESLEFEGAIIPLKSSVHMCVTMNPRAESTASMPDNLQVLFRPVAMALPDCTYIGEVILFAEGFASALKLAQKVAVFCRLASEQLSNRRQYDFGLRTLKSVLSRAGELRRSAQFGADEEMLVAEGILLVRALKEAHGPRLLTGDLDLFRGLIGDLFEGRKVDEHRESNMVAAIESACKSFKLHLSPRLLDKVLELDTVQRARSGVLLVGPAGGGKSTNFRVLADALPKTARTAAQGGGAPEIDVLNPKSVSLKELFGSLSSKTGEWVHGLLSRTLRKHAIRPTDEVPKPRWVVLDGPIDASCLESLNTVLDDNRTFCLSNSERVRLCDELRIFLECDELHQASPATMSRCGAVYHPDASKSALEVYLEGWISGLRDSWIPHALGEKWSTLACKLAMQILELVNQGSYESIVPVKDIQVLAAFGQVLTALLKTKPFRDSVVTPLELDGGSSGDASMYSELFPPPLNDAVPSTLDHDKYLAACVAFSLTWAFGAVGTAKQRSMLNEWCREHVPHLSLPTGLELFEVMVDWRAAPNYFVPWDQVLPQTPSLNQESFSQLIVPTAVLASYAWMAFIRANQFCHTILVGTSGSGKTVVATRLLRQPQRVQQWSFIDAFCSASTRADHMQTVLEQRLQCKKGSVLGPAVGTYAMVFIDDVNAPLPDASGAQPPAELVRQVLDKGGLYNRSYWSWQQVEHTAFLAASALPPGAGSWLSARVSRHFQALCMPEPSRQTLSSIFGALLNQIVGNSEPGGSSSGTSPQAGDVARMCPAICKSTIDLYFMVTDAFKLSPGMPFYAFNFRDVWRVVQGLTTIRPGAGGNFNTGHEIVKLWAHESIRVFQDRLNCTTHRKEFGSFVDSLIQAHFKTSWRPSQDAPFRYGDFMRASADVRPYEQLQDEQKCVKLLQDFMSDYNAQVGVSQPLRLVLFSDAVSHLCRILRALRQHRSHALLIGITGSGRRSLVALASFIAEARRYVVNALDLVEFQDFLKAVVRSCGVRGQSAVVTLSEEDVVHESFLEDIATLINVGHVPNMWGAEEIDSIRRETRNVYEAAGHQQATADGRAVTSHDGRQRNEMDDSEGPWRLFVARVRDFLRVILCMSPAGDLLRARCRRMPSLVTCCLVDYYDPWPEEALLAVAASHLDDLSPPAVRKGALESLAAASVRAHTAALRTSEEFASEDGRHVFVAPKSHLDLVQIYVELAKWKRNELERIRGRLLAGLAKLRSSSAHVQNLEQELTALRPKLDEKSQKTEVLSQKVAREKTREEELQRALEIENAAVEDHNQRIKELREEAKAELEAVMPEFKAAVKAVEKLDKKDIQEIRSFQNPPPLVLTVMQCICMLLGHNTDWVTIKNVISETNFLKRLKDFERDSIPDKVIVKLKSYVRREEFDPKEVEKQSHAAKSLCMWCRALNTYSDIAKEVEPKHAKLREMEVELADAKAKKDGKRVELEEVKTKLNALEDSCGRTQEELSQLKNERTRTERHLKCACELIGALRDEESRWVHRSTQLGGEIECLLGDVFVAAACIAYAGPFTQVHRSKLLKTWLGICQCSIVLRNSISPWSLRRVLTQSAAISSWQRNGLPADDFSTDSAIIMKHSRRFPLCIDPQGQGVRWLRNSARNGALRIYDASSPELPRGLTDCSDNGVPLLVVDCQEQLPRCLEPLLAPDRLQSARGPELEQDEGSFMLYLATSLANPHFLPQVFVAVAVVNFTVGFGGLMEHLLSEVVKLENLQVEMQREDLAKRMADDQNELEGLAERMLSLLSESEGNILDQNDLIDTLKKSKETAARLSERMEFHQKSEALLEKKRSAYHPVAERGALLYFTAASMEAVNQVYVCALPQVIQVFTRTIKHQREIRQQEQHQATGTERDRHDDGEEEEQDKQEEQAQHTDIHITSLVNAVTRELLSNLLAGFFERHRLIAALHFCIQLGRLHGEISDVQRLLLLKGSEAVPDDGTLEASEWEQTPDALCFPESTWRAVQALAALLPGVFALLPAQIVEQLNDWRSALAQNDATLAAAMDFRKGGAEVEQSKKFPSPKHKDLHKARTAGDLGSKAGEAIMTSIPSGAIVATKSDGQLVAAGDSVVATDPEDQVVPANPEGQGLAENDNDIEDLEAQMVQDNHTPEMQQSTAAVEDEHAKARNKPAEQSSGPPSLCAGFPGKWGSNELTPFDQLLLLRAVQPLQLQSGLRQYVEIATGGARLDLHYSMHQAYQESSSRTPVLIVLAPDADPAPELGQEAEKVFGSSRALRTVSLGRGQGDKASQIIDDCVQQGLWVLLQNCDLAEQWVPNLNRFVTRTLQSPSTPVSNTFRLFLACPSGPPRLPVELLHQCLKIACEPPRGVRASFLNAVEEFAVPSSWGTSIGGTRSESAWDRFSTWQSGRGLLVALTLFHSVLRERQKFGSLGFNRPYDFGDGDRRSAQAALALLLEQQQNNTAAGPEVSWDSLECIVVSIYGGRVIDAFDRRCIQATFANFVKAKAADFGPDSTIQKLLTLGYKGDLKELRAMAESLPAQDQPEVFGMHANAEIVLRRRQAEEVLGLLQIAQSITTSLAIDDGPDEPPKSSNAASAVGSLPVEGAASLQRFGSAPTVGIAPVLMDSLAALGESAVALTQSVIDVSMEHKLLSRLCHEVPPPREVLDTGTQGTTKENETMLAQCLTAFRDREVKCFNGLLRSVHGSLTALVDANAGRASMSDGLEETWTALNTGRVPKAWQEVAYPSCRSLASWVEDLRQRVHSLWSWADQTDLPCCFWLSHFFFPQGFLTTVLQAHARLTGLPLDGLIFQHEVRSALGDASEVRHAPARGVYTFGIYLQGARWDVHSHQLEDLRPATHVSRVPVLQFIPVARAPASVPVPAPPASAPPFAFNAAQASPSSSAASPPRDPAASWTFGSSSRFSQGARALVQRSGTTTGLRKIKRFSFLDEEEGDDGLSRQTSGSSTGGGRESPKTKLRRSVVGLQRQTSMGGGRPARFASALERYECPLYRTPTNTGSFMTTGQSTNDVCSVLLPTAVHPSRWILRGVSLICEPVE